MAFSKSNCVKTINELGLNVQTTQPNNDIPIAKPVLELTDDEKFKDEHNNIIEIETRGERLHDQIYFKVKDVSIGFDIKFSYFQ